VNRAAEERYVRRYLDSFTPGGLSGLRVLVYEHSAVGRDIGGRILRELGAYVLTGGRVETFVPIDTENVTDDLLDLLEGLVRDHAGGRPIDAVVSTDGDSDRPLVAAVLPVSGAGEPGGRRVRFLPGDLLGIVVAEYLRADAVVVPVSANDAVERRMRERGVLLRKTKIGSPYVIAAIDELRSAGTHARIVGWEANGGFLLGSATQLSHGVLGALPTRDSTLPILANLFAATEQHMRLAALWDRLPARFGRAGLIDGVPPSVSQAVVAHLDAATLARFFTPALGFDDIERIDVLDGVRTYFENGDVVHIRPSGNAPQLRIYANSDSQARADRIVGLGVREPDGILRMMMRAFAS
jgi:phosphomannomutase